MSAGPTPTRATAIAFLRGRLTRLADGDRSLCAIVGELGIFCRGFRQWNDHEFHRRWTAVFGQSTHLTRPEIERLADLWLLAEQLDSGVRLPCDISAGRPIACAGWREFTDAELRSFCEGMGTPLPEQDKASSDENASRTVKTDCHIMRTANKMTPGNPGVRS